MTQILSSPSPRLPLIDALRGGAVLAMIVYHGAWDLAYAGFITADVAGGLFWRGTAIGIAGAFLLLSGVSLALAARKGLDFGRFGRRFLKLAGAAALVSAATYFVIPEGWVYFGILHMNALGSVLVLPFLRAPLLLLWALSAGALLLPLIAKGPLFEAPWLAFLGLAEAPPPAYDFVPLFPWLAPLLLGLALGRLAAQGTIVLRGEKRLFFLERLGRHSLLVYLVHQPVLFSAVLLASYLMTAG